MKYRVGMWIRPLVGREDCFRLITKVGRKKIESLFFYGDELRPGIPSDKVDVFDIVDHLGYEAFIGWVEWTRYCDAWPEFRNGINMVGEEFIPRPK